MKQDPDLARRYTSWCKDEVFTMPVISATKILNRACDLYLQLLYRRLGLESVLQQPNTAEELTLKLGFVNSASLAIESALRRLADRTGIVSLTEGRFKAEKSTIDPSPELATLRSQLQALGDSYVAAMEFLDFGVANFEESLGTDADFMDRVLSGRDERFFETWHRATNVDPLQDLHGKMGAQAILELVDEPVHVLEIGGGTGNGIRHLFDLAKRRAGFAWLIRYVFTDISMRFVLGTKHEIERQYPEARSRCEWKFCDLNKPLTEQKIEAESVDLIYAVNSAHLAHDLVHFLASCRDALKPGGAVVFAERVRIPAHEMAPRELTLNLSTYHRTAAQKSYYRPMHGYLSPAGWSEALEAAKLRPMILPTLDVIASVFPQQYAAVVTGFK